MLRMYRYTSIGRPLDAKYPTNKAVMLLAPMAGLLGGAVAFYGGENFADAARMALELVLIAFGSWALARELDPDDNTAAFIGLIIAVSLALILEGVGILVVFATLGLVRLVNRSTGLQARLSDSILVMLMVFCVIYLTESPYFGTVAALAFFLDGSLKDPLRQQWVFGLVCLGGTVVYMVDHELGLLHMGPPDSLFEWLSLLFLFIFALDALLLKKVHSRADIGSAKLDVARVRGGMAVGMLAALQGIHRPEGVVVIVAVIAGICLGMAFRKGFKVPATG